MRVSCPWVALVSNGSIQVSAVPAKTVRTIGLKYSLKLMAGFIVVTTIEQQIIDLEWFAVDKAGMFARFTTGGEGALPQCIKVIDLLRLVNLSEQVDLLTKGASNVKLIEDIRCEKYVVELSSLAKKGLFCFEAGTTGAGMAASYRQIAKPTCPIYLCELPHPIIHSNTIGFCSFEFAATQEVNHQAIYKIARYSPR